MPTFKEEQGGREEGMVGEVGGGPWESGGKSGRGWPDGMLHGGCHSRSRVKQPRHSQGPSVSKLFPGSFRECSHSEASLKKGCPHS